MKRMCSWWKCCKKMIIMTNMKIMHHQNGMRIMCSNNKNKNILWQNRIPWIGFCWMGFSDFRAAFCVRVQRGCSRYCVNVWRTYFFIHILWMVIKWEIFFFLKRKWDFEARIDQIIQCKILFSYFIFAFQRVINCVQQSQEKREDASNISIQIGIECTFWTRKKCIAHA